MISDRQNKLYLRMCRITVEDPRPMYKEHKDVGIGREAFECFCNQKRNVSRISLNKIEKFIIQREKELGL